MEFIKIDIPKQSSTGTINYYGSSSSSGSAPLNYLHLLPQASNLAGANGVIKLADTNYLLTDAGWKFSIVNTDGTFTDLMTLDINGNLLVKGEVCAYAVGAVTGGTGSTGGLIKSVYGYSSLGNSFDTSDLGSTFNAYTINQLNSRLITIENKNYLTNLTSELLISTLGYTPYSANNPSGYVTLSSIPTKLSQLNNDLGNYGNFVTGTPWTSQGYITSSALSPYQLATTSINTSNIGSQSVTYAINTSNLQLQGLGSASTSQHFTNTCVLRNENGAGGNVAYSPVLHLNGSDTGWQIQADYGTSSNALRFRGEYNGSFSSWKNVWHDGNFNPANYLPLTGGALSGSLNITGSNWLNMTTATYSNVAILTGNWTGAGIWGLGSESGHILKFDLVSGQAFQGASDITLKLGTKTVIDTGNIGGQSVNYASSAGNAGAAKYLAGADAWTSGTDGWFRSNGACGWYNETYTIGIYATDSTWVRTYNNASFIANRIAVNNYFKTNTGIGLVGDYNEAGTTDKIIWTIGDSWSTLSSHYGLGYTYNNVSGFGHSLFMAVAGTKTIQFSLESGSAKFNGNILANGEVTAYTTSDKRLKKNIKPINNSLSIINKLKPVSYNWNEKAKELNPNKDNKKDVGVIAQELEKILPNLVHNIYSDEQYKGVDYIKLIPYLIGAIQELTTEINKLKNK